MGVQGILQGISRDQAAGRAMDTLPIVVPGAPRDNVVLVIVGFATGRPDARIAGASPGAVRDLIKRLQGGADLRRRHLHGQARKPWSAGRQQSRMWSPECRRLAIVWTRRPS
jgi:hypothetical protein